MSRRLQQVNKYRNAVGKVAKKEEWYADLPVATSSSSDKASLVQVSNTWMAVKWTGNGGSMGLLPLDKPGKTCVNNARVFHAHAAPVSDWQFSPFDDNLLATGGEEGAVKLWRIPEEDNNDDDSIPACLSTLSTPSRRVDSIVFHPTADQILSTLGNDGKKIFIWDLNKSSLALETATDKEPFQSYSWKSDGSLVAMSSKGSTAVWDPRASEQQTMSGTGHEGIKGTRIIWLGDSNYLFSVGMTKFRSREYALWDVRNLSSPIKKTALDTSTGVMQPLYDEDTETIYLLGRGDATVRSMQISDLYTGPSISENMPCATTMPVYGATLLRKQTLDVMHAEIARVLAVVDNNVVPISYQVPRKQYLDFHAKLFPDTKGNVPALDSEEWLSGKNALVAKVSLDPAKRSAAQKTNNLQTPIESSNTSTVQQATASKEQPTTDNKNYNDIKETTKEQSATEKSISTAPENTRTKPTATKTQTTPSVPENKQSASSEKSSADEGNDKVKPTPSKSIRKFGPAEPSVFKYIDSKLYHPSKHYDDLRGLSIDKSGNFDLIQANVRFISVPLSGPGGRVGVILSSKTGRLPLQIPSVLCGSSVTNFRFDPFSETTLATVSEDNKIRLWKLPEAGLEEDISEADIILSDPSMDKVSLIEYHPNAQDVLLSVSHDLRNPTLRIWDVKERKARITIKDIHGSQAILYAAWSMDGSKIATHAKDKQLRVIDARSGEVLAQAKSHEGIRPSRIVWLNDHQLASIGFGLGSMREILVFDLNAAFDKPVKRNIDVSPSVMSMYFDNDCQILYAAGRGDRIIHTFALESNGTLDPLAKIEAGTLQQGLAFLPKRTCDVANVEIARFYRLTPTSIEPYGVRVPRARPEYFQDDIFIDTRDTEHPAQDSASWFDGKDVPLARISLKPDNVTPLSQAPPPPQQARAKAKFEMGKKMVSDEERRQQLMDRMFSTAKDVEGQEGKKDDRPEEEKEVADDEWDD